MIKLKKNYWLSGWQDSCHTICIEILFQTSAGISLFGIGFLQKIHEYVESSFTIYIHLLLIFIKSDFLLIHHLKSSLIFLRLSSALDSKLNSMNCLTIICNAINKLKIESVKVISVSFNFIVF